MSAITLQSAIRDLILAQSNLATPTMVPTTSLTAQANVGDTTLTVADTSRFNNGSLTVFNDTLGEEPIAVTVTGPTQLTLDFTGLGYTGLKYTHPGGTQVYSNLWTEARPEVGKMLVKGDPVIQVFALDGRDQNKTRGGWAGETLTVRVQYHRALERRDDEQMDPNVFAGRQSSTVRSDIDTIKHAILNHRHLSGNAIDLGIDKSPNAPLVSTVYHPLTQNGDTLQFVVTLNVTVQDQWYRWGA